MLDYTNTSLHFKKLMDITEQGKNSEVFRAHDYQLDAVIVVKKIKKSDLNGPEHFFKEAKMLYASSHDNIVPIQYACQDEDHIYISMPDYERGSLNKLISERFLTPREIIRYGIDFLSGLHHIHAKGLIHCDVKANNILISASDDATLTDFGLAKYLNLHGFAVADEFYYLTQAPENFQAEEVTHQTDIYQAGLTLYSMCNGNEELKRQLKPFLIGGLFNEDLFKKAVLKGKFPERTQYPPHIPQKLKNYIRKALEPDPSKRYESVLDLLNDLAGIDIPYDWQFLPEKDRYKWSCENDGKTYVTEVTFIDDKHAGISVTKTLNKTQQINAYFRKKVTHDEAFTLAKQALNNKDL
ncbi:serine/threonine-protein kinase [Mucilaginibacter sp. SP1R1]|uniref:serine/threonine-protein kinase n=1 Tax=Mucilaginibacter sp. SP1R1 TaxID=2723091 RepID=UPI0016128AF1|nr:serine/threonine-protein kinase [Mucilaginibacter sp. SP1R1]MBB6149591.1 serine/threonine protein kinase [Mucilaginibacter sp. SP1R1]